MADLRCPNGIKFAELEDGLIEVKCRSSRCGAGTGVVVLHRFHPVTGELIETRRYRDPAVPSMQTGKEEDHDDAHPVAVRSA